MIDLETVEEERLRELQSYQILDTPSESEYDAITRLASYICQTPVALITFVDSERVWVKSRLGVDFSEFKRNSALCHFAIEESAFFEINRCSNSADHSEALEVFRDYDLHYYAGYPLITPAGYRLGTLCVVDYVPRQLDEIQKDALKILSNEVISHLEIRRKNMQIRDTLSRYEEIYTMFDASAELHCVLDRDTHIRMINRSVENLLGYSVRESLGRPIGDFILPEDAQKLIPVIEDGLRNKHKYYELETRILTKCGEVKWVSWSVTVNQGKWYANGRDITYQKKMVSELEQLSLVASKVDNGVIISGNNKEVLWVNEAFERITGYSLADLEGHKLGDVLKGEKTDAAVIELAREYTKNKKSFAIDLLAYRKDGHPIWLSVINSVILDAHGEVEKEIEVIVDITARKNVEQELETLSLVASKSATGVVIRNAEGLVTWVNEALEDIVGYRLDELFGKELSEFVAGSKTDQKTLDLTQQFLEAKKPYNVELQIYKKDGSPIWVLASTTPIFNKDGELERYVEIIVDITERKYAEEQLTLLSLVASKTVNGVIISDDRGHVNWVNEAFEKMSGYSLDDLKGRRADDFLCGEETDRVVLEQARALNRNNQSSQIELLCYRKDGSAVWFAISSSPTFNADGSLAQKVAIINDITERKQGEQELIKTREEALQLSKAKEKLLSVMSHEIRTPLNAVIGMSHILMDDNPTEGQMENLKILNFSAQTLLTLINDILDFTKIETGKMILEAAPVNLKELVSQTLNTLQYKAIEKGVALKSEIDYRIPARVLGDHTRLFQILVNLLGNAVKFTEEGEVRLKLDLLQENNKSLLVRFEIADTGIGIPENMIENIFDIYTQASTDTTRKYGGTGLGLAITKSLVELHNSCIFVSSEVGKGTTFSFSVEFERSLAGPERPSDKERKLKMNSSILVVDDNDMNRLLASKVLSKWGARVAFAENGKEALEMISGQEVYDLVLMDVHMPEMDGMEATRAVRALKGDYYRHLPIIALTASALAKDMDKVFESGMNDYVMKPFIPADLFDKIQAYL